MGADGGPAAGQAPKDQKNRRAVSPDLFGLSLALGAKPLSHGNGLKSGTMHVGAAVAALAKGHGMRASAPLQRA